MFYAARGAGRLCVPLRGWGSASVVFKRNGYRADLHAPDLSSNTPINCADPIPENSSNRDTVLHTGADSESQDIPLRMEGNLQVVFAQ